MSIFSHFNSASEVNDLMARKYQLLRMLERENVLKGICFLNISLIDCPEAKLFFLFGRILKAQICYR